MDDSLLIVNARLYFQKEEQSWLDLFTDLFVGALKLKLGNVEDFS